MNQSKASWRSTRSSGEYTPWRNARSSESRSVSNQSKTWRSQSEARGIENDKLEDHNSNRLKSLRPQSEVRRSLNDKPKYDHTKNDRQFSHFSFKKLESLLEDPLEEVIRKLIENEHFFLYIGTKLSSDCVVLIAKLLSRFCDCSFTHLRTKILQKSLKSDFVVNLQFYISNLSVQTAKDKKFNSCYWNDPDAFWNSLIRFCDVSLREIPHFFVDHLLKLVKVVLMNIPHIEEEHQVHISDEIKENFKSTIARAEEIVKISVCQKKPFERATIEDNEGEPPEDFHEMDIFPTTVELVGAERPFLRRNVVIGPYEDVNHYLDVQFRLLREDFVGPLREGIKGHLAGKKRRDIQHIIIHPKVQFMHPVTVTEDHCVLLKFHFGGKLSNFKYEDSKKFMFGSLVCFTKDNFNSIIFGRIVDRKAEYLRNGQLVIGFHNPEDIKYNSDYIMVECSVYFEPYYHVLKVLKQIQEIYFPMKNYIVDVEKIVLKPNYGSPLVPYEIESNDKVQSFYLFDPGSSPTFEGLNQSQNNAFIAALTRKFSIIQGPPGTGKTYVGLKVARTLLKNSRVWFRATPMLVICFTNHALDQFLEGLIGSTDKMVRIGGQSKNEKLLQFNLRNYARKMDRNVWRAREGVTCCLRTIKNITDNLNEIARYDHIMSFKNFTDVIPNYGQSWLANATNRDFLEWLLSDGILTDEVNKFRENNEDHTLVQQFESIKMEDSESIDEENEIDERNDLDELLMNLETNIDEPLLDLNQLGAEIRNINIRLNTLEPSIDDDTDCLFEFMTLRMRHERLKAIYEFVKMKLDTAPREITEVPKIDARKSKYINIDERWNLYFYWLHLLKERLLEKHRRSNTHYRAAYNEYNELREMGNVEILRTMKVIGMTTTSAARLHSSLQLLRSPIVIVEEAAEVLEAHIVSALTNSCQQLILIGDHQQLRPSTANYTIEKDYKLGISLFERMVKNEVQCFTLDIQHRMRPEISSLIKPTIYPNLKDHESVMNRPLINGVEKCLYFIDHKNPEEEITGSSKKNIHEAKFLVHLARYLILNGYESHQITILAAYLGQMFEIQKLHSRIDLLKGVRVSVLDNYQGEESDIILLSLVRNNENTIGFLSIENRVCVALSRARNGLYVMGNMSLLCEKSKLWEKIRETLLGQEAIGPSLTLKCQNHGKKTMVSTADNFCLVPEGGCDQICDSSLACGHKCKMLCHALDRDHEKYVCTEICNKLLCDSDLRHICRKMCAEECGPCMYPKNATLDCGHDAVIPCHMDPEDYECQKEIEATLPCGHDAIKPCYIESALFKCKVPCDARLECGHACMLNCHMFNDPDHIKYKCPKPCERFRVGCMNLNDEEHKCSRLCHEECEPCKKIVLKPRTVCPHHFHLPCNQNVDEIVCEKPCKKILNCGHKCKNTCGTTCSTCTEKVKKKIPGCNHIVKLPCNVEADKIYCDQKCPRELMCGHTCGGLCRDDCASFKCKEMVKVAILAKCGHVVKEVPCFVKRLYNDEGDSSVEGLESYCTEPCTALLNCSTENKHQCSGTCGTCYQGRIHKRCAKKCNRILICNHQCNGFCLETCKPCTLQCSYKCKHSVCKKRCGDLCIKCKETCNRKCEHQKCKKKCGEICNVPPCERPCKKTLTCGHPCIGFCSEPCPPLCRICNKDEVEEVFFGDEDEEDARFIVLNDCGHVFESSGMKQWLEQKDTRMKQIGFKVCPKCKTNIFTTERYSDYVKKSVENILLAKITEIGTEKKINDKRKELLSKIEDLSTPGLGRPTYVHDPQNSSASSYHLKSQLWTLLSKKRNVLLDRLQTVNRRERRQAFNLVELNAIEIKYQLIKQVYDMMKISDIDYITNSLAPTIKNQINLILNNLFREVDDITSTEIDDIQRECKRLHRMIQMLPLLNLMQNQRQSTVVEIMNLNEKVNKLSQYDEATDNILKDILSGLRKKLSLLAITELEREEIVKAIGLSKGHWYMCPNGHPYAIGECGGAMELSVCPECKASIGGQSHTLVENNRVATFMDGATHSAWSSMYHNMNNYRL